MPFRATRAKDPSMPITFAGSASKRRLRASSTLMFRMQFNSGSRRSTTRSTGRSMKGRVYTLAPVRRTVIDSTFGRSRYGPADGKPARTSGPLMASPLLLPRLILFRRRRFRRTPPCAHDRYEPDSPRALPRPPRSGGPRGRVGSGGRARDLPGVALPDSPRGRARARAGGAERADPGRRDRLALPRLRGLPARGRARHPRRPPPRPLRAGAGGVPAPRELLPEPLPPRVDPLRDPLAGHRRPSRDLPDLHGRVLPGGAVHGGGGREHPQRLLPGGPRPRHPGPRPPARGDAPRDRSPGHHHAAGGRRALLAGGGGRGDDRGPRRAGLRGVGRPQRPAHRPPRGGDGDDRPHRRGPRSPARAAHPGPQRALGLRAVRARG